MPSLCQCEVPFFFVGAIPMKEDWNSRSHMEFPSNSSIGRGRVLSAEVPANVQIPGDFYIAVHIPPPIPKLLQESY